jgi:hypothetical protein
MNMSLPLPLSLFQNSSPSWFFTHWITWEPIIIFSFIKQRADFDARGDASSLKKMAAMTLESSAVLSGISVLSYHRCGALIVCDLLLPAGLCPG